ncbi:GDYXXLXY domain-containing protein [Teredinibacter franksiae]|uniref:GDYXXLXY domain-containing protein n=1 Tax=Teredinibacter franksiae TaxID=2761453 RepID=UPI001624DB25|nr:GDYXXLXY domain-containing protein [Teredinibacter franksiae]
MISRSLIRKLIIVAIAAQLLVLLVMAGKREFILAKGDIVYLRSAPIDPRDPFRGDFVRLQYDFNRISISEYHGQKPFAKFRRGDIIYGVLKPQDDQVYFVNHFTDSPTNDELAIKGRITTKAYSRQPNPTHLNAKFGIEQYFVQQGKGKEMEATLGSRNSLQVPVEMKIALGDDGTAVIGDHRWSNIGVQLSFERATPRASNSSEGDAIISPLILVSLENVSNKALVFATRGDDCDFSLSQVDQDQSKVNIDTGCTENAKKTAQLISLAPGENHTVEIDMSKPRWHFMDKKGNTIEMGEGNLWRRYRLRYTAPLADNAWQGFMNTPAFRTTGNID